MVMAPIIEEAKKELKGSLDFKEVVLGTKESQKYEKYFKTTADKVDTVLYLFFDSKGDHLVTFAGAAPKDAVMGQFRLLADGTIENQIAKLKEGAPSAAKPGAKPPKLDIDHKGLPTLVFYYADWCPYCRKMMPAVDKVTEEYKGKIFVHKLDVDAAENKAFVAKYRLNPGGIPYFQYFDKKGKYITESVGAAPEESFIAGLKTNFKLN